MPLLTEHDDIVKAVSQLPQFEADNSDYIDFSSYTVPHGKSEHAENETYTGWRYSLCFDIDGSLVGAYYVIKVNTPNGWTEDPVPAEHQQLCLDEIRTFTTELVNLSLPVNIVGEAQQDVWKAP